ncbi:unnamed protein product [Vicia faba]|uniref:LOB domain-containing protein n=1 Tax=Vicia faba TaxID=3906 RepID=A0AAV0ZA04_VICFA|nr:unnamed protein product [Vicia faba]
MFHNVNCLYGVVGILRILDEVPEEKRDLAMRTIIYESNVRAIYPIHGCVEVIKECYDRIKDNFEELYQVKKLLDYCKVNHLQSQIPNLQPHFLMGHSLRASTSSQIPNLEPQFLMDYSLRASTSYQIPNIPIFNNVGNNPNYYHNSENNIEATMNASPPNTNWNKNSRVTQLSEGVSNNKESDLFGGVDTHISAKDDLNEEEK